MRFSVSGALNRQLRLVQWLLIAVAALAYLPSSFGQAIECPATHSDIDEVDFSGPLCRDIVLSDYVMASPVVWIKIPLDMLEVSSVQHLPMGLFISGNMSLNAFINNQPIGSKGHPASDESHELAGPFDWVGYIEPDILTSHENTLTLYVSSHANLLGGLGNFNRIYVGSFGNTTDAYNKHYAPSLIPLGAMLIALSYMLSQRVGRSNSSVSLILAILVCVAILQLIIEVSRGVYAYQYWLHLPRLYLITFCSFVFGQCLLLYSIRHPLQRHTKLIMAVSIVTTLFAQSLTNNYDLQAVLAFQVPTAIGVLVMLWIKLRPSMTSSIQHINFILMLFTLCVLVTLLTPNEFLDSYVYYFIAILILALTHLESDKKHQLENMLRDTKQQANRLELALSIASKNGDEDTIKVKSAGQVNVILVNNIFFCKAAGDYVELVCCDKTLLYSGSLQQLQDELPASFLKVHRSYLVNAKYIVGIKRKASGNGELQLSNEAKVPVSRALFAEIRQAVSIV